MPEDKKHGTDQDSTAAAKAAKDFKLTKGADVMFHALRAGNNVEGFPARVTTVHSPRKGDGKGHDTRRPGDPGPSEVDEQQLVDLEFDYQVDKTTVEKRTATEIRRGRGAIDAPCWTPIE